LPEDWKESITVPFYKKGSNTACSNYSAISRLSTVYTILSSILLSRFTPYARKYLCGFSCNRSTTDHTFCIHLILEKIWEYNETVHQLFIDFKKAYDSVRREVLYITAIEFGFTMKLVRRLKMCLNERYSRVRVGKHLSDVLPNEMV
jgi:hypothetical protein